MTTPKHPTTALENHRVTLGGGSATQEWYTVPYIQPVSEITIGLLSKHSTRVACTRKRRFRAVYNVKEKKDEGEVKEHKPTVRQHDTNI